MELSRRKTCRVCNSKFLTKVIDLGNQYLQGSFVKTGKAMPSTKKYPTSIVFCDQEKDENACGLLQMEHTVSPKILYSEYWYRSGINKTMREHLHGITKEAIYFVERSNAIVLDIGCNDGTLLKNYPQTVQKFGVDPSDIAQEVKDGMTVIQDLYPSEELRHRNGIQKFDVISDRQKTDEYLTIANSELSRLTTMVDKVLKTSAFSRSC